MPEKPRSAVFDPSVVGAYHCWNRIVRRRHLLGEDAVTGKDFSYRKDQLRDRFRHLAQAMAVDILDYAILDNHLHVVLRNRPDIVAAWSDEEVALRWWFTCPLRKNKDGSVPEPRQCELDQFSDRVDELRKRLSDISWLMRLACQPIARQANKEDGVDGRFFAKRFDCERLESEEQILNCSLYVDLNWIRAGMAESPEHSTFTSAYDRIRSRWQEVHEELCDSLADSLENRSAVELRDDWLAPIQLAPCDGQVEPEPADKIGISKPSTSYNPVGTGRVSNKGFLSMTLRQYVTLLDSLGRVVVAGKRGCIPNKLPPILERLGLHPQAWFDSFVERLEGAQPRPSPDIAPAPG